MISNDRTPACVELASLMAQMTKQPRDREASHNGFADTWSKEVSRLGASEIVRRPWVVHSRCGVAITRSEFNASHRSATHGGDTSGIPSFLNGQDFGVFPRFCPTRSAQIG